MAENSVMLVAIEMDARGAIQSTQVLDSKFTSLGATLQKGQQRMEGAEKAQNKLNSSIQQGSKNTIEGNVALIGRLAAFEALTSGLNQLISAQYKRIDADLAAGKISAEEAEKERKRVKQYEKITGSLETLIAISRLYTVAEMIATAVKIKLTAATEANTAAVVKNNAALAMNPWVAFAVTLAAIIAAFVVFGKGIDNTTSRVRLLTDAIAGLREAWSSLLELANPFDNILESEAWVGKNRMNSQMGG
jgi:hypothetical protein